VGSGIAEILGIPSITIAGKIEIDDKRVSVKRMVADGYEVIEALIVTGQSNAATWGRVKIRHWWVTKRYFIWSALSRPPLVVC
jgi:hypothetical protein